VLGGTGEARDLAAALMNQSYVAFVSSLAGRVERPRLPVGEVRIGGFGGPDSLATWLRDNEMTAVIDATHPYASGIRRSAIQAASTAGVAYLRLERPGWTETPGDRWHRVPNFPSAARLAAGLGERIFLTIGRQNLSAFTGLRGRWVLARVVDEPDPPVNDMVVLRSRGPYTVPGEVELLTGHRIDVLVTKDSGGALTEPKLVAARRLRVPVVMIDRPAPPDLPDGARVTDVTAAVTWVQSLAG
jgi:precorrin-6A/cobalt-precorrin-6A reductase